MKTFSKTLILSLCIIVVSCKGILDEEVYSFRTTDNFYQTEEDLFTAITGAYAGLQQHNYFRSVYFSLLDGCIGTTTRNASSVVRYTKTYNSTYGDVQNFWRAIYANINVCNDVINGISTMSAMPDSITAPVWGEAKYIRAMDYFNLVRVYGAIPLRMEPSDGFENAFISRTSEKEVYELIISDLTEAATVLPKTQSYPGRATKGAALGLLAKVYLTLASMNQFEENPQKKYAFVSDSVTTCYTKARDYALAVKNLGVYKLVDDYSYLWDLAHENSSESLFEIQFIRNSTNNGMTIPQLIMPSASGRCGLNGNGWASYRATKQMFDEYEVGDYRVESTFLAGADGVWDKLTDGKPNGSTAKCYPATKSGNSTEWPWLGKYQDPFAGTANEHECNFPYLRYADVLLILAEAENEISPLSQTAYNAINEVRTRARNAKGVAKTIPANIQNVASKEEFRELVWKERRLELNSESHLWYDLIRTGQYQEYLYDYNHHSTNTVNDIEMPYYERNLLFPIPANEISNNEAISLEDQNPGHS